MIDTLWPSSAQMEGVADRCATAAGEVADRCSTAAGGWLIAVLLRLEKVADPYATAAGESC